MNTQTLPELEDDCWFLNTIVPEFTEEDKIEAINVLYTMAKTLAAKDNDVAQELTVFATKLKALKPDIALNLLSAYLKPAEIQAIANVKSFIYLKKISDKISDETKVIEKRLSKRIVLSMSHIVFYKTLPCSKGNQCRYYPRKIVHKNDFLDDELDCYFYHHEKDRRRFVLNDGEKEFRYAGNFGDGKRGPNEKSGFSQNFFESLYHPLYYKNFRCVRTKCDKSVLCPYNHSHEEKTIWATIFKNFFGKDREIFTKKRNSEEEKNGRFFGKRNSGRGSVIGVKRLSCLSTGQ